MNNTRLKLDKAKEGDKKKLRKKIKISPFLIISLILIFSLFLLFTLVLIPALEKSYSSSVIQNIDLIKVGGEENHFDMEQTQEQFDLRKASVPPEVIISEGQGTTTPVETGTTTPVGSGTTGSEEVVVIPVVQEAERENPFN
jgi:hypothetical protein